MTFVPARTVGAESERLRAVPAVRVVRGATPLRLSTDGSAFVPASPGDPAAHSAISDGNRCAIIPGVRATFAGREWLLSVKGVGASTPAYGDHEDDAHEPSSGRVFAGESWMGDAPYGGQGEKGASWALEITTLAGAEASLAGALVCPVVGFAEVPEQEVRRDLYWYRRFRGPVMQEHRLVPSDVRLFHGGGRALGRDPEGSLRGLGVCDVEALDAFADRYLCSGLAALTLWARTAQECAGGFEGLDYDDVWLDKDSVLGADGSLFLVDLESIEWAPATPRMTAEQRVERQLDRNFYEVMYGLDAMLDVRDGWLERPRDLRARRESVATRIVLAARGDRFVEAIDVGDGIDLRVRMPGGRDPLRIRVLDRR